jgi:hypothetical protein
LPQLQIALLFGHKGIWRVGRKRHGPWLIEVRNDCDVKRLPAGVGGGGASLAEGWQAAARNDAPSRKDNFDISKGSYYLCLRQLGVETPMCKRLAKERLPHYTNVILTL